MAEARGARERDTHSLPWRRPLTERLPVFTRPRYIHDISSTQAQFSRASLAFPVPKYERKAERSRPASIEGGIMEGRAWYSTTAVATLASLQPHAFFSPRRTLTSFLTTEYGLDSAALFGFVCL
ncbi:hypothetical protein BU26DRAFT_166882 [Trematosphaeria pertusa]|uniref:Uncharacterized protein n=1 Tax=Trematosphaeria pertusa TaxID=390896 RepID=A0A6A6HVR0_9PLEO|nr:uncharacterized protein BU26DRAFT_166882 [Trematosphaeria pertusa]KAF2242137.1 hypothetical protein BU26DRAFT_166882 [Trematosphaeria pertusa]